MRVVKLSILAAVLTVALAAPGFALEGQAQTPPKPQPQTTPPKPQTPTQQPPATPPAAQPAAPKPPSPPVPFPQDAKYAVVDVQAIAQNSVAGKAASAKLNDLNAKNSTAIQDKAKQLQALQAKRDSSGVLNDAARAQLDKDIDKLQRDIQYAQTSAQAEMNDLNTELQTEFQKKLIPIIEEIAKEKGLYLVFTADSGFAYINPGLNISDEVIKRLDAKKN
jgi:Skp family chaperone for outer membrane proteins